MPADFRSDLEVDPRFPSGAWEGFWQPPARTATRMTLRFARSKITGDGQDPLGTFKIRVRSTNHSFNLTAGGVKMASV